eukprot:gene28050-11100_t
MPTAAVGRVDGYLAPPLALVGDTSPPKGDTGNVDERSYWRPANFLTKSHVGSRYADERLVFGTPDRDGHVVDRGTEPFRHIFVPTRGPVGDTVPFQGLAAVAGDPSRDCTTTNGVRCHFPFSYDYSGSGELPAGWANFSRCTTAGWDRP